MKRYLVWKKHEMEVKRVEGLTKDDNGAEITIHMDNIIWYPEYY